ncbi:MAG: flagellar hook-basal body complex protein FliE [Erythrobacter sp.]|nr:MAG: flagellar hook-basal body complex protein FliE [Erythrobacter sp.]
MSSVGPAAMGGLQDVLALRRQIADQSETLRGLRESGSPTAAPQPAATTIGGGFAETLRTTIDQVSATQARSSAITEAYERGEVTDIAQVMLARQESSVAFEATLQVRNKLLSAYQEIMRMGV